MGCTTSALSDSNHSSGIDDQSNNNCQSILEESSPNNHCPKDHSPRDHSPRNQIPRTMSDQNNVISTKSQKESNVPRAPRVLSSPNIPLRADPQTEGKIKQTNYQSEGQ